VPEQPSDVPHRTSITQVPSSSLHVNLPAAAAACTRAAVNTLGSASAATTNSTAPRQMSGSFLVQYPIICFLLSGSARSCSSRGASWSSTRLFVSCSQAVRARAPPPLRRHLWQLAFPLDPPALYPSVHTAANKGDARYGEIRIHQT
jgi:hypothetical protein